MPSDEARAELADCARVISRLHKMCCDPGRSPRLLAVERKLTTIRTDMESGDREATLKAIAGLEEVGSRIGSLQVACCAPPRMPLYAAALRHLNVVRNQLASEADVH